MKLVEVFLYTGYEGSGGGVVVKLGDEGNKGF